MITNPNKLDKLDLLRRLGLDEAADVLPVAVAELLDGVQQPHLLPRIPLLAPVVAVRTTV